MISCTRLAVLLAEAIQNDRAITALCETEYGRRPHVMVGTDRRKALADKISPLCLLVPSESSEQFDPYADSSIEAVLCVVDDRIAQNAPVPVLNGLLVVDDQLRPEILRLAQNLPVHVGLKEWRSVINIDEFPLIVEQLTLVLSENFSVGKRLY